jgi:hypothetical protein
MVRSFDKIIKDYNGIFYDQINSDFSNIPELFDTDNLYCLII